MEPSDIVAKFGDDYCADDMTYVMGIDQRLTAHFTERFRDIRVLETCTGAGFTTIALARAAKHVVTVEIDPKHQAQARENVNRAGYSDRVSFVTGDSLNDDTLSSCLPFDSAFLDPDWAVEGPDHTYRFRQSNTRPPADELLGKVLGMTPNVAIVLPPFIDLVELSGLPKHERQSLYLDGEHVLFCLYFGALMRVHGDSELIR